MGRSPLLVLLPLFLWPASGALAAAPFLPLADGEGLIFCPEPGCTVPLVLEGGATQKLAVGTKVKYIDDDASAGGDGTPAKATVEAAGKKGTVPTANVITADRLARSPDGQAAVFYPIESCGDGCHTQIWVLTPKSWTQLEGADALEPAVAWSPDGKKVVVGAWALYTVELPGLEVSRAEKYYAPAYAPDGTLYIRARADDAVFRVGKGGALEKLGAPPKGKKPRVADAEPEDPIPPVKFEADGKTIVASFRRVPKDVVVRYKAK
jgi:hypothetical protein